MGFRCGIVGLPNVGKSTLFNALTDAGAQAENYPFCTIDPNVGMVPVPDPRLSRIAELVTPQKVIPTTIEFVDIAGLVAGASKGEGLGNQFLAHIREVDAIAHVVRCFDDENIVHVSGVVDPAEDIATVSTELILADMDTVARAAERARKASKAGDPEQIALAKLLERVQNTLDGGDPVGAMGLNPDEVTRLKPLCLLTAKPVLYVANVADDGFQNNPRLEAVRSISNKQKAVVVPVCAGIEVELVSMSDAERQEFLADMGLEEAGLDRVIHAGYSLLGLLTFFTAGPKEARAWTVPAGARAPQAAGVIHTDFERGFIRAEITAYEDFVENNGEQGARDAGKLRLEGKDYVMRDGDVVHFRFNV